MNVPKTDYRAHMIYYDEKYILKAGSHLRLAPRASFEKRNSGYFNKWQTITTSSMVEKINDEVGKLLEDLEFSSPSAAGAIVKGGATNGLVGWRNKKTGLTIKEELLEKDEGEAA